LAENGVADYHFVSNLPNHLTLFQHQLKLGGHEKKGFGRIHRVSGWMLDG
jgi:hypothetical protein